MNNSDFKEAAEKYKQEMLSMYKNTAPERPAEQTSAAADAQNVPSEKTADHAPPPSENTAAQTADEDEEIEKQFPPPYIPEYMRSEGQPLPEDAFGYLKVTVRTGSGAIPIAGNSVIVSETIDGKENLVKVLVTNDSGETDILRLPTYRNPTGNTPEDYKAASLYNISVSSKGYFSEVSSGVSIFDGITSVQNFLLVPKPFNLSTDVPIVYENPEPEF